MRFFYTILMCSCFVSLHAFDADYVIQSGSACNNLLLYEEAADILSEAIKLWPSTKEAYQERAISYFELGNMNLALQDYRSGTKKNPFKNEEYRNISYSLANDSVSLDFATGLLLGIWQGSREETIDFLVSLRGSVSLFWAAVCTPIEVSKELINALQAMGHFLATSTAYEVLEEMTPEIIECREYWHDWSARVRGEKMGYILGKYGVTIFCCATMNYGVSIFNRLKRANMMAILERHSLSKGLYIIEESAKYSKKSTPLLKKALSGSIVAHNPNVAYHVLQKKHRWGKFVPITGNIEEDFRKVVEFLEKNQILKAKCELDFAGQFCTTYKYSATIQGETVIALFEMTKNNRFLLRNAWIETPIPYRHN